MTNVFNDEELIESLRLWNRDDAAARIEALTKERDALQVVVDKQGALLADAYGADLDWEEVLKQRADHEALRQIEQLVATNEALMAENKMLRDAVYIDDLTVTMQARDRSKAIEGIGRALDLLNADMIVEAKIGLRATLAEIKGKSHE